MNKTAVLMVELAMKVLVLQLIVLVLVASWEILVKKMILTSSSVK